MFKRNILDCTLRDGGYINNWKFSNAMTKFILKSLVLGRVDYVECGYISNTKKIDGESTYFENFDQINALIREVYSEVGTDFQPTFCIMLNRGEYDVNDMPICHEDSFVKDIRFAFHKKDLHQAYEDTKILLDKGYQVFAQPMVTQLYSDLELLETITLFNELPVKALYIVDSFGNMTTEDFKRLMFLFHHNMRADIQLGYHSHNNLQLAFSNAIAFLNEELKRDIFLDSSIFGMGRGAGNLNTELMAHHLNNRYGDKYSIEPLLETMDSYLHRLHQTNYWGYSIEHYLSATLNCHPNSATYLLKKKNLTIMEIEQILSSLTYEMRNKFDSKFLDSTVLEFLNQTKSSVNDLFEDKLEHFKEVILIGAGAGIEKGIEHVLAKQKEANVMTIALNHVPKAVPSDVYLFTNQKRYKEFQLRLPVEKLVVTSNIQLSAAHTNAIVLDFGEICDEMIMSSRNISLLILNYIRKKSNIRNIYFAGLDGYPSSSENNYSFKSSNSLLDKEVMAMENEQIGKVLQQFSGEFVFTFLSPSIYQRLLPLRICGVIPARYASSRFNGKPLALINGVPMIKRTYLQAKQAKLLTKLVIATDSEEIFNYCQEEGMEVVMTSTDCLTGTDRIAEYAAKENYDLYVNIQGDEPIIDPSTIDQIVHAYRAYGDDYVAYNLYKKVDPNEKPESSAMIKVITNQVDELMYMSRLPVPFSKSELVPDLKKQVCVYGYTSKALKLYSEHPKTLNEKFEDIEILRFLDLGYKVKMLETESASLAVDFPEDIAKVEEFLNGAVE